MTEDPKEILNSFRRKVRDNTTEEPPEIRRRVNEQIWDLFPRL